MDHDQIFKTLLEGFFEEFVTLFCPQQARLLDLGRVEFLQQEYFTDVQGGERKRLDVVAKIALQAGGEQCVLVHVESEASRKDADFPRRFFRYHCQLFAHYNVTVVPIALFTDDAVWRKPIASSFALDLADKTYVRFEYHLVKLKHLDYRLFLESDNPLAFALMAKMAYNRRQRVRLKADFLRLVLAARVNPAKQNLLADFIESYMPLSVPEVAQWERLIAGSQEYQEVASMITAYEQRGIEKGIQQGIEKGIEKGEQKALLLLWEKKFGAVDDAVRQRILNIHDGQKLERLLAAILDAQSPQDLEIEIKD